MMGFLNYSAISLFYMGLFGKRFRYVEVKNLNFKMAVVYVRLKGQ
jgi:hypothetical protein